MKILSTSRCLAIMCMLIRYAVVHFRKASRMLTVNISKSFFLFSFPTLASLHLRCEPGTRQTVKGLELAVLNFMLLEKKSPFIKKKKTQKVIHTSAVPQGGMVSSQPTGFRRPPDHQKSPRGLLALLPLAAFSFLGMNALGAQCSKV